MQAIYVGQFVWIEHPVTVWVLSETVLEGQYVVEKVRGDTVKIAGVWVPSRVLEVVR